MAAESNSLRRRFQLLIKRHSALYSQQAIRSRNVFEELLAGFQAARGKWAESQRTSAESRGFVDFMVAECESMIKFTPILDEIYGCAQRSGR